MFRKKGNVRFSDTKQKTAKKAFTSWKKPQTAASAPVTKETSGFSQMEIQEFKESFALFDVDGTGSISVVDFRNVLESLQESPNSFYPHLDQILDTISERDDNDTLDFEAFLELMESTSLQQNLETENDVGYNFGHIFSLFDVEGKGYITISDLERIANELGEQDMTVEELEEMIERASSEQKGQVTLAEFSRIMTLNLFNNEANQEEN